MCNTHTHACTHKRTHAHTHTWTTCATKDSLDADADGFINSLSSTIEMATIITYLDCQYWTDKPPYQEYL